MVNIRDKLMVVWRHLNERSRDSFQGLRHRAGRVNTQESTI